VLRLLKWVTICLASLVGLLVVLLVVGLVFERLVPAESVELLVPRASASVRIELYLTSPIGKAEFARRLVVQTPRGTLSQYMSDDWGGATRTSIYLTDSNEIAILGPAEDDYLISFNPMRIARSIPSTSEKWEYLGAFDRGDTRLFSFRFFQPHEQTECIPTMGDFPPGRHRTQAYRSSC